MKSEIRPTDAVRRFSELLNNIKYRGDHYTIIRGGKPTAALVPVDETGPVRKMGELPSIFQALPHLDPEDTSFLDDVLDAVKSQPLCP